jgi:hypothetical protein
MIGALIGTLVVLIVVMTLNLAASVVNARQQKLLLDNDRAIFDRLKRLERRR